MEIGTKIRKVREIKGLSQENLADELGMSVTGYGKIERNEVGIIGQTPLQWLRLLHIRVL